MSAKNAEAFLDFVAKDRLKRKALANAVIEELVAAGKMAGYNFTSAELDAILEPETREIVAAWSGLRNTK